MFRTHTAAAALAGLAIPAAVLLAAGPAVAVAPDDVVNTETVQARLDATGAVTEARVYEQIANPVSTQGLRNLDGFGALDVDGAMVSTVDVQGRGPAADRQRLRPRPAAVRRRHLPAERAGGRARRRRRRVRRPGGALPGHQHDRHDRDHQLRRRDRHPGHRRGRGRDPDGRVALHDPPAELHRRHDRAGERGRRRSRRYAADVDDDVFPPIGSATAEFGCVAKIRDGVVPPASVSALPVRPLESPSFAAGAESYAGGAETGAQLTGGATEIDANLLKLRDGASDLLAGLTQLSDGAEAPQRGSRSGSG